jgi:type IV secretory pathway VirD2 relaxase
LDPILTGPEDPGDLPIFRPRMGRQWSSMANDRSFRNVLLRATRGSFRGGGRRLLPRSRVCVACPGASSRRVIVKAHVVRMTATGAKAAALHLRYIEREGVEKDGSKGVLYSAEGLARARTFEQPRRGEEHQFRLIISPEDAGELDLSDYVRRLMTRVERDIGRKLEWAAVNHYNTEHPHAHLVIRGVDRDGREVRLDRGYIANGLRWSAQELATEELGPRPERDVRIARSNEVTQARFTSLDRELERRAGDQGLQVRSQSKPGRIDESTLLARLRHLEALRLADRVGPTSWTLTPGWQDELRELGARGDILKQIHKAIAGDPSRYRVVRPGKPLPTGERTDSRVLTGRVADKGLSNELKGSVYAVIETPSGDAYHVPLGASSADQLRVGDIVSLKTEPLPAIRPIDREIADAAGAHGGVYTPAANVDGSEHPHGRRLRELERIGLAAPIASDCWTISPNLLEELERRSRESPPRHRLIVRKEPLSVEQQVAHPGPVWLDRLRNDSLDPDRFGAELRDAIGRRREALRKIDIPPDGPKRTEQLRELERRTVAREVVAHTGQAFVENVPPTFRGRAELAGKTFPASGYLVVSDGLAFVLVRATASLRAVQGQTVTLAGDTQGRILARTERDRGIGS